MRAFHAIPRLAELSLEAARQAGSLALSVVRTVSEPVMGRSSDGHHDGGATRNQEPPPSRPVGEPPPPPAAAPAPAPLAPAVPRPRPAPAPEPASQPAHVDREAVLVAESADPGAADGAGATIRVEEPWDGYGMLKARDVIAQLATADAAMLAVVRLYESANRNRRTVVDDIDRRLKTA